MCCARRASPTVRRAEVYGGSTSGRGGLSVFGADDVPDPGRRIGRSGSAGLSAAGPNHPKPETRGACAPSRPVWSWDITRLLGAGEVSSTSISTSFWTSSARYVTGWMVADRETAGLGVAPDRGNLPQAGRPAPGAHASFGQGISHDGRKCTAQLLADLGVTQSLEPSPDLERQRLYSEAHFQEPSSTTPFFPGRFAGIEEAKDFCAPVLPVVQPGAQAWRYRPALRPDASPPRSRARGHPPTAGRPRRRLCRPARASSLAGPPRAAELKAESLDQPRTPRQ